MRVTAADVEELAQLTGLQIPPQYCESVARQYAALLLQAELVLGLPLDDALEPAAVFTP